MSLRDDVVLRVIHQLVEALLRAAGLRRKKDLPGAEQAIGDGLGSLGLPLALLATLDVDTLRGVLQTPERCAMVAAALYELGRVRDDEALLARADALLDGIDRAALPPELLPLLADDE